MAEPNKMLEETANYLLNHCFVLGGALLSFQHLLLLLQFHLFF